MLLLLLGGLSLAEATGVTNLRATVIRIFTPDGTLVVETDDPAVRVTVEGDGGLVITGAGLEEIRLRPGSYRVHADRDGKRLPLDRDLVAVTRGGRAIVKVKLETSPTSGIAQAEKGAFVLLGSKSAEVRRFDTLAEAVRYCAGGDTIEVRGDGPFDTRKVTIKDKALTIRAASGCRPVIRLAREDADGKFSLIRTNAPLVLEGLELHRVSSKSWRDSLPDRMVWCEQSPLHAANCRFFLDPGGVCIHAQWATCRLVNCEFLARRSGAVDWPCPQEGSLDVENCLLLTAAGVVLQGQETCRDISARLTRSTWCCERPVEFLLDSAGDQADRTYRVEASENVFAWNWCVLLFAQTKAHLARTKALEAPEAEAILSRLVGWGGRRNVYSPGRDLLGLTIAWEKSLPASRGKDFPDWQKLWGSAEKESVQGTVRWQAADALHRLRHSPLRLTPRDFRLSPESFGKGSGEGGRDLGADVDLVGPGPAYERWKKTPEYQQWVKDTKQ